MAKGKKRNTVVLNIDNGLAAYQLGMQKFEELIRSMDNTLLGDQVNSIINGAAEVLDKYIGEMFPKISIAATVSLFGYVTAMGFSKSVICGLNKESEAKILTEIFHVALTQSLPAMVEHMKKMKDQGKLKSDVLIVPGEG